MLSEIAVSARTWKLSVEVLFLKMIFLCVVLIFNIKTMPISVYTEVEKFKKQNVHTIFCINQCTVVILCWTLLISTNNKKYQSNLKTIDNNWL